MLLAEPDRTPYDFHFELLGFPVRVTPFFWVAAAVLGWGQASFLGEIPVPSNPGQGVFLLLWIAAMFLSILVHELGHTFAMRHYGMRASIVLYHFGGLAIPDSYSTFGSISRSRSRANQLAISAAGPAAQIVLAMVVILGVEAAGYSMADQVWPLNLLVTESLKPVIPSLVGSVFVYFLAAPSIYWALLNLLPIFPLDGGQISRELFTRYSRGNALGNSLSLSMYAAIGCAVYSFSLGQSFLAMFFVSLAVSSYQLLQATRFGGGSW